MRIYWLWLATRPGMTEREKIAVLSHFDTPEDCYFADAERYAQIEDLSKQACEALCDKDLAEAEAILQTCRKKRIHILAYGDSLYPSSLKNISDPPLVLYYRGTLPEFDESPTVGVVGTRKASAYGMTAARKLGREIAAHGGLVVSGMAEGIDAMATQGALDAGMHPVGVLGNGVDRIYPTCNRDLFRKMEQQGCLISEYPPGTPPNRWQFPKRNRIISGLCRGVLVVEAPLKSGALITARQALEQGRDVFVIPGNIGVASCEGSNALLRDGATAVFSGWDILSEYTWQYPDRIREKIPAPTLEADKKAVDNLPLPSYSDVDKKADDLDAAEQAILTALGKEEQLVDTVIAKAGIPPADALAALTMLEVKGYIITRPGGWVYAG